MTHLSLQAIVLDCDGVLLESLDVKTKAFEELFRAYPEHRERVRQLHLDNLGMSRYDKFRIIYRDFLHQPLSDGEMETLDESFSRLIMQRMLACPMASGADVFLERFSGRYALFVASATPEAELRAILEGRGIARLFKGIYGAPTTKADILQHIRRTHHWEARELIFVGDALSEHQAAAECGVPFVGRVENGQESPFPEDGPLATVTDLGALAARWADEFGLS